ncbi:hypothetical protein OS493_035253 [Desmophyllum pertusum]|uniref:Uncharacterized protein n=1 Tax=Desmophyllum pertusum TaxID=174260 RepID=A0A9X0D0L4_9CNID|nr:hypothetical protein OS493_035253 [Desmophyllum pertusum]
MKFDVANFKQKNITKLVDEEGNRHSFMVQKYFEVHKLTQARIYLTSKKISTTSSSDKEIEEDYKQQQEDKGKLWHQEYASVKKDNEDKEKRLRRELEDVNRLEGLHDSQRLRVSVKHCLEGDVSGFFLHHRENVSRVQLGGIFEFVPGALQLVPEARKPRGAHGMYRSA